MARKVTLWGWYFLTVHKTSLSLNWREMNYMDELLRCVRNWLDGHTPVAQSPNGDQWQVVFLRDQYLGWCCLTSLLVTGRVGASAPSSSLLMTPSWVEWSTRWRRVMPSRATWTGLRDWPVKPHDIQKNQVQGPANVLGQSCAQVQAGRKMNEEQP